MKQTQGLIIFSTDKGQKVVGKNAITVLGDMWFKARGLRDYAVLRGIEEGMDFINTPFFSIASSNVTKGTVHSNLAVYLLDLSPTDIANLTPNTQQLPIYTGGNFEIDPTKIVGWASLDRSSVAAKQGVFAPRAGDTILDEWMSSLSWQWDVGKATGTFNCVAIGLNIMGTNSNRFDGLTIWRGIEPNDVSAGEPNPSGFMLRPGVSGITGPNEILIGGTTTDGKGRIKYDLVTKAKVELAPGEPGYDFQLTKAHLPQLIVGNRLLYIHQNYVWYYDTVSKARANTNIYVQRDFMFIRNSEILTFSNNQSLQRHNASTYAYVGTLALSDMLGVPTFDAFYAPQTATTSTRSFANIRIGNYKDKFIVTYEVSGDYNSRRAVVVADIMTPSIVEILPRLFTTAAYEVNNEMYLFDWSIRDELYGNQISGITPTPLYSFGQFGVKYCKYRGNLLSYKIYDTPQTIAADEVAKVEYVYKYGN